MEFLKLNKKQNEILTGYKNYTFDKSKFLDEQLLKDILTISLQSNCEIALLISRKSKVLDIFVGDSSSITFSTDNKNLQKTRIIHTHPNASYALSDLDLSLLKKNSYDCVVSLGYDNLNKVIGEIAFFNGNKIIKEHIENAYYINKYGYMDKIFEYDKMKVAQKTYDNLQIAEKAILVFVSINSSKYTKDDDKTELYNLANTAGVEVVGEIVQKRQSIDGKYYIGEGKLEELKEQIQLNNANLVIFDNELSGSKQSNLLQALGVKIIDRSMLILDIFAKRAKTSEGKLQVELAQLKYSLPRLSYLSQSGGRFGAGTGMRGPGETKLEVNRRVVENNIVKLSKQLDELKVKNQVNRKDRMKNQFVVAIVGYTNSGKSSLLNLLAKDDIYVKDELFATLDTTTRSVWLKNRSVLFTDTVGFIDNLPHEFINAFSSTLQECVYADLLLHIVDISNPNYKKQMEVTLSLLEKLGSSAKVITVYNKIDKIDIDNLQRDSNAEYISVLKNQGIDKLKNKILKYL